MEERTIKVKLRFINIMQRYSDGKKEVEMLLPPDANQALEIIIEELGIPWKEKLNPFVRVFVNKSLLKDKVERGEKLQDGDLISFIPMSGGG